MQVLQNDGLQVLPPPRRVELISLMSVNNEIGAIWTPGEFAGHADFVHSDMTQAVGKLPIDLHGIAFASLSAHKFYGPKGVGALYFKDLPPKALLLGGEQEHELRGGTLNVPGIVGMGMAAALAEAELEASLAHAHELRAVLLNGLRGCTDWQVLGGNTVSPYIVGLSFHGLEGETLVVELDRAGFAISSGAACSSHSREPSHVLAVLDLEEAWARGTVRISFGRYCTLDSVRDLSNSLRHAVENIRRMNIG
jgi:cysteine desulfurase